MNTKSCQLQDQLELFERLPVDEVLDRGCNCANQTSRLEEVIKIEHTCKEGHSHDL
jgi:hypothetical protein